MSYLKRREALLLHMERNCAKRHETFKKWVIHWTNEKPHVKLELHWRRGKTPRQTKGGVETRERRKNVFKFKRMNNFLFLWRILLTAGMFEEKGNPKKWNAVGPSVSCSVVWLYHPPNPRDTFFQLYAGSKKVGSLTSFFPNQHFYKVL